MSENTPDPVYSEGSSTTKVLLDMAQGQVTRVTKASNHYVLKDGKPMPGTGRDVVVEVPFDSPEMVVLMGEVSAGLAARVAQLEAALTVAEAEVTTAKSEATAARDEAKAEKAKSEALVDKVAILESSAKA